MHKAALSIVLVIAEKFLSGTGYEFYHSPSHSIAFGYLTLAAYEPNKSVSCGTICLSMKYYHSFQLSTVSCQMPNANYRIILCICLYNNGFTFCIFSLAVHLVAFWWIPRHVGDYRWRELRWRGI